MVRQIILTGFVVLLPVGMQAQGHGGMASGSHAGGVAPRMGMAAPHPVVGQATGGTRMAVRGGAPRLRTTVPVTRSTRRVGTRSRLAENEFRNPRNCNSAPGLGFDEVHLAATCGPGSEGFRRGAFASPYFFPFYEGGFYVSGSTAAVDDAVTAEIAQPDAADEDNRDSGRRYRVAQTVTAAATENAAPGDNDEFVFVRRDGTLFFAVAYAWDNGTLRYINSQGLRRTLTQDALDLDATRQFNEQRGFNFRSPA